MTKYEFMKNIIRSGYDIQIKLLFVTNFDITEQAEKAVYWIFKKYGMILFQDPNHFNYIRATYKIKKRGRPKKFVPTPRITTHYFKTGQITQSTDYQDGRVVIKVIRK